MVDLPRAILLDALLYTCRRSLLNVRMDADGEICLGVSLRLHFEDEDRASGRALRYMPHSDFRW